MRSSGEIDRIVIYKSVISMPSLYSQQIDIIFDVNIFLASIFLFCCIIFKRYI